VAYRTVAGGSLAQNTHLRVSIKRGKNTALSSIAIQKYGDSEGKTNPLGRFPANLILGGEEVVEGFPISEVSGAAKSHKALQRKGGMWGKMKHIDNFAPSDSGSASRFFFNFAEQESDE
jgi:hypothetical protein